MSVLTRIVVLSLCMGWFVHVSSVLAETFYTISSTGCANNGDGTASNCAASGGAPGAWRRFSSVTYGAGAGQVSDGDTLYICGLHDAGVNDNTLVPTTSPIIDGDCPGNPGIVVAAGTRIEGGWTGPDAFGAYSISIGGQNSTVHAAQCYNGERQRLARQTGVPDSTWVAGEFYQSAAGATFYVKPLGGVDLNVAGNVVYSSTDTFAQFTNVHPTLQNLTIDGLASDYCIRLQNADGAKILNVTVRWCRTTAVRFLTDGSDDVEIANNTFSHSGIGIYTASLVDSTNSNRLYIHDNTFTDMDYDGYYGSLVVDNHAIGLQGGDDIRIVRNDVTRISGTCITAFAYAGQSMKNINILSNTCDSVENFGNGTRLELGIEFSAISASHDADDVAGGIVAGNVVKNVKTYCMKNVSGEPTIASRRWQWVHNTLANCRTAAYRWGESLDGNVGFVFSGNLLLNNAQHISHGTGTDVLTSVVLDSNLYYPDGAAMFDWDGVISTLADFKTNSGKDGASLAADPQVINSSDFRTSVSSPARMAGSDGFICADARGRACYPDRRDIGAYQSTSGDPAAPRAVRN